MDKKNYTTPAVRSIALHTNIAAGSLHINDDDANPANPMMAKKGFLNVDFLNDYSEDEVEE